ncbi:hypothetical protein EVAR_48358_1 [Eumeta japonica]|uniref:Uncharacterized protein n=1 Tax=Eumeta variegata TaxID=151549 RepID=A0A4C1WMA8_EUMVA|nr:hypothetical protein EVAR_48358_1 [Eumeta japonica]
MQLSASLWYTGLQHCKSSMVRIRGSNGCCFIERALTVEMVKFVGSYDQLDGIVETYTECIRQACDATSPPKNSKRRLKLPWQSPELRGVEIVCTHQESAHPKHGPQEPVERHLQDYQKNEEKAGGCPTSNRLGTSLDESATLLAETFFPDDRVNTDDLHHTAVRRRTDGDDEPPITSGIYPGWIHLLPGLKFRMLFKYSILVRLRSLMDSRQTHTVRRSSGN